MIKFANNRWAIPDALIVMDIVSNLINKTGYDVLGAFFGIEPAVFNSVVSLLEVGRFIILAHQVKKH